MLHPAAPILLLLVASLLLLVCGAPPAPQPGSALKQTSRKEILERRAQHMNASQRRQSPGVCPAPNPVLTAAVYLNRYVGSSSIIYVTTANFDDCVARCAALTNCNGGDDQLNNRACWLTASTNPGYNTASGFNAFFYNRDCAANAAIAPSGTACCDY